MVRYKGVLIPKGTQITDVTDAGDALRALHAARDARRTKSALRTVAQYRKTVRSNKRLACHAMGRKYDRKNNKCSTKKYYTKEQRAERSAGHAKRKTYCDSIGKGYSYKTNRCATRRAKAPTHMVNGRRVCTNGTTPKGRCRMRPFKTMVNATLVNPPAARRRRSSRARR